MICARMGLKAGQIDRYISHPLTIKDGFAQAPETPGIGFTFDEEGLSAFCVNAQEYDLES